MKKYDVQKFELLSNEQIADGIFDMRVKNDELAPLAKCGQFAHVYVPSKTLRRPTVSYTHLTLPTTSRV